MSRGSPPTGVWLFPEVPAPELVALAQRAEDRGLAQLWLGDEGPAREPFAVLAAAAVATSALELAVGVTNPYLRHPGVATAAMLTVHELSGGRATLGVGAGGQMSLGPFGLAAEEPLARVAGFLEIARSVCDQRAGPGYDPPDTAIHADAAGGPMPLFVGGRGPAINRLASRLADGAFVAGMPPFHYDEVIGWAREVRPIQIALYPSVAFDEAAVEHHRPEMIWSLLDTPDEVRDRLGLELAEIEQAAAELRRGHRRPARALVSDEILGQLMLVGEPATVGRALARLVTRHRPDAIGLALLQADLARGVDQAAEAFEAMTAVLEEEP